MVATMTLAAQAQTTEKLTSLDGRYSVEIVRNAEDSLVISKGGEAITKTPTSAGPVGSLFEALWSPDGSYVAINKQRSSRPSGDYMWVIALPSGKVLKQPDDSVAQAWEKTAKKAIERHFAGIEKECTQGKEFLSIKASGWQDGQLQFLVQQEIAGINVAAECRFAATADPRTLTSITSSQVSNPSGATDPAGKIDGMLFKITPEGVLTTVAKFPRSSAT